MAQKTDPVADTSADGPTWKQRAVGHAAKAVQLRADQRVERFLDAAQAIIAEKGSTDFTVQEVADRSRQSLRSFYQHFDGKHELLLALLEKALGRLADEIRAAVPVQPDPLSRLRVAVQLLFEASRPDPSVRRPMLSDFAWQLLVSHPSEVKAAHVPVLALFTELMTQASDAGCLRPGAKPRRLAALTMQTVMFTAQSSGVPDGETAYPITADEVWEFCATGFASG